jgi:hypothetical protein
MQRSEDKQAPAPRRRYRRATIAAAAGVVVVAVGTAMFVMTSDDPAPSDRKPSVAVTSETTLQDPLITRFGERADEAPLHDPLIIRFGR